MIPSNANIYVNIIIFSGNQYHQYDFFVYPRTMPADKGYWKKAMGWLKGLLPGEGEEEGSVPAPLSTAEMVKRCLLLYLKPYQNVLQKMEHPENFKVVREVRDVYRQHKELIVQHPIMYQKATKVPVTSVTEVSMNNKLECRLWICVCHRVYSVKFV